MNKYKQATKEQAEQFAALFFGQAVQMEDLPLDEFIFRLGSITFKVFNFYGAEKGSTAYPFEFPFGQVFINGRVVAAVLLVQDKNKQFKIENVV